MIQHFTCGSTSIFSLLAWRARSERRVRAFNCGSVTATPKPNEVNTSPVRPCQSWFASVDVQTSIGDSKSSPACQNEDFMIYSTKYFKPLWSVNNTLLWWTAFFFYSWNTGFPSCTWHGSLHCKIPLYWIFHTVGGSDVLADMKNCKGMGMLCCVVHLLWFILFLFQGVWWGHSFLYLSGQESTNSRDNMTLSRNLPLVITCSAVYYGKLNNTKI